jgi:hypothetical protein
MKSRLLFAAVLILFCLGAVFAQSENNDTNAGQNQTNAFDRKLEACDMDDKLIFEVIGIKDILLFTPDNEEVELISFETSTGIDFVKVCAANSTLGIRSEYAWAYYTYPEFKMQKQSLVFMKINDVTLPCDLVRFENGETGEEIEIFFDISEFFGKW